MVSGTSRLKECLLSSMKDALDGLRRPCGQGERTVQTGREDHADRERVSGGLTPRRPPRNHAAGAEPIRGGRRVNARRALCTKF